MRALSLLASSAGIHIRSAPELANTRRLHATEFATPLDHHVSGAGFGHACRLDEPVRSWRKEQKRTTEDGAAEPDTRQHPQESVWPRVDRKLLPRQTE